jgi:hypothetical protein
MFAAHDWWYCFAQPPAKVVNSPGSGASSVGVAFVFGHLVDTGIRDVAHGDATLPRRPGVDVVQVFALWWLSERER